MAKQTWANYYKYYYATNPDKNEERLRYMREYSKIMKRWKKRDRRNYMRAYKRRKRA